MSLHGDEHDVFADDGDDGDATAAAAAAAAQANNGSAPSATTPASSSSAAAGGSGGLSAATNALPLATTMAQGELRASSSATPPSMHHINISSYIPFKLDLAAGNYSKWRQFMFFVLSKFDVQDHVEVYSDPLQQSATWRHDDITIVLWFYATLSDELYDVVMTPASTAYQVWDALHTFFRDNQPGRAIHLSAEFRGLVQGDLSIQAYCRRLKSLSDALADVDEPVTNRTLTLQLLCGLNRRFQVIATVMSMQIPFPTFVQARSRLLLEETALNERDRTDRSTALYIGNSTTERGSSSTDRSNQNGGGNNDRGKAPANDRGNGGDRGRGNRGRGNRGRGRGNANGNGNGGRGRQRRARTAAAAACYHAMDGLLRSLGRADAGAVACSLDSAKRRWGTWTPARQPISGVSHDVPARAGDTIGGLLLQLGSAEHAERRHEQPADPAQLQRRLVPRLWGNVAHHR